MDLATFHALLTVVMLVAFIALIVWAWSGKRRRAFDEAARLPLEDDDAVSARPTGEKSHV
jgi:cbb3-type cytochrome oxidase subunit 3